MTTRRDTEANIQSTAQVSASPPFARLALIGFGLIGGSIARAAREQGLAGEIVTTARSAKTRARVNELGIVDRVVETNTEAVKNADLVILCIPVGACGAVAQEIAGDLEQGAIVSDVGSVKGAVVTISRVSPCSRAARAIELPISPKPISASLAKGGLALACAVDWIFASVSRRVVIANIQS